jgi:signal peptidase I
VSAVKTSSAKTEKPVKKKSVAREWFDSILFAVVAATLIRWLFMEAFTIPTPSMERSLMVGDFLFVSKFHYGTRTPKTPLQVPLTHQKIWGTEIPSYLDWIQLPQFRLPGFSSVKNGDVVVFNYPPDNYPTDLKTNYIKRCIGIGGDVVEVRKEQVFVNGKSVEAPPKSQTAYFLETDRTDLDNTFFRQYGIESTLDGSNVNWQPLVRRDSTTGRDIPVGFMVNTSESVAAELRKVQGIKSVSASPYEDPAPTANTTASVLNNTTNDIYCGNKFGWSKDNFGPLTVPKEGVTIQLDSKTVALYGSVIQKYEGNQNVVLTDSTVSIGGKAIKSYTFKQDYYFMMGDNRHNSLDSRYWGFVPADHVVGKAIFIWMSIDPNPATKSEKIRWNRLFNVVK